MTDKHTNTQTDIRTFQLIERIGPEGRFFENYKWRGQASFDLKIVAPDGVTQLGKPLCNPNCLSNFSALVLTYSREGEGAVIFESKLFEGLSYVHAWIFFGTQ